MHEYQLEMVKIVIVLADSSLFIKALMYFNLWSLKLQAVVNQHLHEILFINTF